MWFCSTQLTLTIRIHLIRDRPNPEMAPYRPAAEVVRQKDRKNPIQLKRNATEKAGEKQQVKTPLYSKEKNKTPLHTGFSWCYMNINVTQTILGHCLGKKFLPSGTYWRKSAWKCHHFLSSAGQCHQSHPVSQNLRPAKQGDSGHTATSLLGVTLQKKKKKGLKS